ncbi:MAG: hypothetical protein JRJ39_02190 [Deltaproteobacteria bacterium]|nr:hypothetical protein [Deltaproteobacteria bacterium]
MRLKHSVNPVGLKPEMILALLVVDGVYSGSGSDCILTSINDSFHFETSRHYQGMAIDFRIRHLPAGAAVDISNEISRRLGIHYNVRLESDHIHISYKPRKP